MDSFLVIKKTISSHTFYIYEIFLENFPILLQSLIAVSLGTYFNSVTNLYTASEIMTYYLAINFINSFQRHSGFRELEHEISNGMISNYLVKPINLIYFKILKMFSTKIYQALINLFVFLLILFIFFKTPVFNFMIFIRALIIIPITLFYYYVIIGLFVCFALVLEKISNFYRIFGMSAFFLGGGLVPTENLPRFLSYLPQQFIFGSPAKFILTGTYTNLFVGVIYFIFFIILLLFLNKIVMKRLETNGG